MKQHSSKNKINLLFFSGIGRTLVVSFLVFAIIPMLFIGIISYKKAYISLRKETEVALKIIATLKMREVTAYFKDMTVALQNQAETEESTGLLQELKEALKEFEQPVEKFVKTAEWAIIADKYALDIRKFRKAYEYYDVFLISKKGDILYSVSGGGGLGTNIFSRGYRIKFTHAVRRSIETCGISFSGYDFSGDQFYGFLVCPVVNSEESIIGIIAIQFSTKDVKRIVESKNVMGKTAVTYLVGSDLNLLFQPVLHNGKKLLTGKRLIKDRGSNAAVYNGLHGKSVIGVQYDFMIQNIKFGIIAEIEEKEAFASIKRLSSFIIAAVSLTMLVLFFSSLMLARYIVDPLHNLSLSLKKVEDGDLDHIIEVKAKNEIGNCAESFNNMVKSLKVIREESILRDWLQTGQMELGASINGCSEILELSRCIVTFLAEYMKVDIGAIYTVIDEKSLKMTGGYACFSSNDIVKEFGFGQGFVGQAALGKETIVLKKIPEEYMTVHSAFGKIVPSSIVIKPFIHDNEVAGVIEFGSINFFPEKALKLLDIVSEQIAVAVKTTVSHIKMQRLLGKTQNQSMELRQKGMALIRSNKELEKKTYGLEKQAVRLESQKKRIEKQKIKFENAKKEIEKKAIDLEVTGRYKSEFLANMSHELRTPLNSILILSKYFVENNDGNLTKKQQDCGNSIFLSGKELLKLIDGVLDLSKIDAGKMDIEIEKIALKDIVASLERTFKPVAENKHINFDISLSTELPETILIDEQKVYQILKNLLSNAFKFTDKGSVSLEICWFSSEKTGEKVIPNNSGKSIAFIINDTGIGIPENKKNVVFQAFKQVDGSINRKYGGTGLGLSISLNFAEMLGGYIHFSSREGKGSTFILCIPEVIEKEPVGLPEDKKEMLEFIHDKKNILKNKKILIVDDDMRNVFVMINIFEKKGIKTIVAGSGKDFLVKLKENPDIDLVFMDIMILEQDGQIAIKEIREMDAEFSKVPVIALTENDVDGDRIKYIKIGASDYLTKPVDIEKLLSKLMPAC